MYTKFLEPSFMVLGITLAILGTLYPKLSQKLEDAIDRVIHSLLPTRCYENYIDFAKASVTLAGMMLAISLFVASNRIPFAGLPLISSLYAIFYWIIKAVFIVIIIALTIFGTVSLLALLSFVVAVIIGYVLAASSYISRGRSLQTTGLCLALIDSIDKVLKGSVIYRIGVLCALAVIVIILQRLSLKSEESHTLQISLLNEVDATWRAVAALGISGIILSISLSLGFETGWRALFFHNEKVAMGDPLPKPLGLRTGIVIEDIEFGVFRREESFRESKFSPVPFVNRSSNEDPAFAIRVRPVDKELSINMAVFKVDGDGELLNSLTLDRYEAKSGMIMVIIPISVFPEVKKLKSGLLDILLSIDGYLIAVARIALSPSDVPEGTDMNSSFPIIILPYVDTSLLNLSHHCRSH